jgi:hypothetical protein
MLNKRVVLVIPVIFLVGIFVLGWLTEHCCAQDKGRQDLVKVARQALSVPEIIDTLVSFPGWDSPGLGAGPCLRAITFGEIVLMRQGQDKVKAMSAYLYYPERISYQTLQVDGPILRYATTVNVCDAAANNAEGGCESIVEWTTEVVSRTQVNVTMKVLRGGSGAGVATGQTCSATFKKK